MVYNKNNANNNFSTLYKIKVQNPASQRTYK